MARGWPEPVTSRSERPEHPLRVLFVCTANISRSPYAERRARQLLGDTSSLRVTSAGVPGCAGREMDPAMVVELEARGGSADGHVSRSVTGAVLEDSDVVVTVEFAHRLRIFEGWPEHAHKVWGLNQLADAVGRARVAGRGPATLGSVLAVAGPDGLSWDVDDPYRRGRRAARRCADEIDAALAVILPALDGIPAAS